MFNLQSFSSQKAPVSDGNTSLALARIRRLLTKLLHSPETGVLELVNDDVVGMIKGMVVAISSDTNQVILADADGVNPTGFAICLSDSVLPNNSGYFRFMGETDVLFVPGLDPAPNEADAVVVSDTAGYCTNDDGVAGVVRRIGLVVDASEYVAVINPFARVIMEPCCAPLVR